MKQGFAKVVGAACSRDWATQAAIADAIRSYGANGGLSQRILEKLCSMKPPSLEQPGENQQVGCGDLELGI